MASPEPPACPAWCADLNGLCTRTTPEHRFHMSGGNLVALPSDGLPSRETAFLIAYAAAADGGTPGVALYVRNADLTSEGTGALPVSAARAIARLAELLADATPEAHRAVAEAVREAIREGKAT